MSTIEHDVMNEPFDIVAWIGNSISWGVVVGTIVGALPAVAALVAIAWGLLQMYESRTFQHWYNNWRQRRAAKRYAIYKAKMLKEEAVVDAVNLIKQARVDARQVLVNAETEATRVLSTEGGIPPSTKELK